MLPSIKGFLKNTLIDWEGKIASEVFLPGCNFACPICHSPHLVRDISDETIPFHEVEEYIISQAGWIDGIVVCGGEPTLHKGLAEMLTAFHSLGIGIKLDTNGSRPDVLKSLIERRLVDFIAMDIKAPLNASYHKACGKEIDLAAIEASIELLLSGAVEYEFRTTVCPRLHSGADIVEIAKRIKGARRYILQQFRPGNCLDSLYNDIQPITKDELKKIAKKAGEFADYCGVRGESDTI